MPCLALLCRDAPAGTKAAHIYKFTDAREVEITARCCRLWLPEDDEVVDPDAVRMAEKVMKAGMVLLSKQPFMIIIYSSFLIDVQTGYQSGYTKLQTAKKLRPGILERYGIFAREQQHQKASTGDDSGDDMGNMVEYQKNVR